MSFQFEEKYAIENKCVVVENSPSVLTIFVAESNNDTFLSDDIHTEFPQHKIVLKKVADEDIILKLVEVYGVSRYKIIDSWADNELFEVRYDSSKNSNSFVDDSNVIETVNRLLTKAIYLNASDIHFEVYENAGRVRFRLDGKLHVQDKVNSSRFPAIISRIKIMANLDIGEKRRPQDGRIQLSNQSKVVDIRVSIMPTEFGEKAVLRILDKQALNLNLENIGFDAKQLSTFKRAINAPYGMILVTGPTGSGKTTTLYSALNELNSAEQNILTIEDPIEYNLEGINQSQVKADIGFSFANALRSFLRQDPNIIMVGEMRDSETADIAIRSALTGHLVFSTLHTNDSPSTIARLYDMEIEPFLIGSSVRLILAQRLLRKICTTCKVKTKLTDDLLFELKRIDLDDSIVLYEGSGCDHCYNTGYKGRTAIVELMQIDEEMASLITQKASVEAIRKHAEKKGMQSLTSAAKEKLKNGETSLEEVIREIFIY
jgi:type IV pilus assembly protein PilB